MHNLAEVRFARLTLTMPDALSPLCACVCADKKKTTAAAVAAAVSAGSDSGSSSRGSRAAALATSTVLRSSVLFLLPTKLIARAGVLFVFVECVCVFFCAVNTIHSTHCSIHCRCCECTQVSSLFALRFRHYLNSAYLIEIRLELLKLDRQHYLPTQTHTHTYTNIYPVCDYET